MPHVRGPYEKRLDALRSMVSQFPVHVKLVDSVKCSGYEHLKTFFADLMKQGAEGVILRAPDKLYEAGRSGSLFKYKVRRTFVILSIALYFCLLSCSLSVIRSFSF